VAGPVILIPLEYPALACRHVDLPEGRPGADLAERLLAELDTPADERWVAYRAGERLVRGFERRPLPPAPAAESARFRHGGVYLITGGLGGLGLATAEHLAAALGARLALVGRTGLPPREEWDGILSAGDRGTGPARAIALIRALEERGSEVLVLRADVADRESMRAAVDATLARFGALHGVIHAAGVPAAGLMQTKTAADFARVLAPKVQGARVLDEVLRPVPLDFLVLFSSATAVTGGGPGQVDYCAANAFLDAFAQARSAPDRAVVSIGWGEWRWNAWGAAMEGLPAPARRFFAETRARLGIDFAGGMDALERAVVSGFPFLVVSPPDFRTALALSRDYTVDLFLGRDRDRPAFEAEAGARRYARAELKVEYVEPASDLERRIAAVWQRVLGIEEVGASDNFFDLGGNSLIGLKVTAELQRELGREVLPLALYEAPTVGDLARLLQPSPSTPTAQPAQPGRAEAPAREEEGIAIVGMAGRFPRAASVEELWRNLLEGREGVTFFGDRELLDAGVDPELLADPLYVRAGGVLDDIARFDADLFDVPPEEAALLDPQHRLFLECAWAALEDAGHDPARHPGRIGVFGGSHLSTYLLHLAATPELHRGLNRRLVGQCNSTDTLTTRVSYKLNLRGPSVAVQTFSSTSGVAIHLACESLQRGSCEMALAGGVQVSVPHRVGYLPGPDGIDSQDGHTRSFDARARGALQGNGVAIVVLKRLSDAVRDGDHIYAVIRGSAINNDGSGKVGFTAPSVNAVAEVVGEALEKAGVPPETLTYVEATGGATEIGDAIEVAALTRAFRSAGAGEEAGQYCALGSVKSSVGHLLIASGATAVIKTALALRHGQIPPNPTFQEPNPRLLLDRSPFYVQQERTPWPRNGAPRRAGVNIQGVGGTNVHLILEEPPMPPTPPAVTAGPAALPWQLLVLSAHTSTALETMTDRLATRLRDARGELDLADVCATLQQGRRLLRHRRFVVCRDIPDAISCLESRDARRVSTHFEPLGRRPVRFLFPDEAELRPGLGRDLYEQIKGALPLVMAGTPEAEGAQRFEDGLDQLLNEPHAALSPPYATGDVSDLAALLEILGKLWQRGVEIDWQAFHRHERRLRVPLPTYPFEGNRHWLGSPVQEQPGPGTETEPFTAARGRSAPPAGPQAPSPDWKEGNHEELV
jgi:3-oxoacyl-(acyl-carrier-protein) synthase/NAD(P)-dependent dehydrogenase (short-subunit alcohol dehydrogenase family)/acyl carrier protein